MSNQILINEQQHNLLSSGKEDNLIDDNLSYKMMLMMSKMNESTTAASQAVSQYQQNQNNSGSELVIKDHSMNESLNRATPPPQVPQLGSKVALASCPVFESHYWRFVLVFSSSLIWHTWVDVYVSIYNSGIQAVVAPWKEHSFKIKKDAEQLMRIHLKYSFKVVVFRSVTNESFNKKKTHIRYNS